MRRSPRRGRPRRRCPTAPPPDGGDRPDQRLRHVSRRRSARTLSGSRPMSPPRSTARTSGSPSTPRSWRSSWASTSTPTNKDGDTALHLAAGLSLDTVIPLLVEHGARLDAKNKRDQTALAITTVAAIAGSTRWSRASGRRPRNCCRSSAPRSNSYSEEIMAKRYVFPLIVGGFVTVLAAVLTSVPTTAVQSAGDRWPSTVTMSAVS